MLAFTRSWRERERERERGARKLTKSRFYGTDGTGGRVSWGDSCRWATHRFANARLRIVYTVTTDREPLPSLCASVNFPAPFGRSRSEKLRAWRSAASASLKRFEPVTPFRFRKLVSGCPTRSLCCGLQPVTRGNIYNRIGKLQSLCMRFDFGAISSETVEQTVFFSG